MYAHHVVDEAREESAAAKVGVVSFEVGSLRTRHLPTSRKQQPRRALISCLGHDVRD